MKSGVVPRFMFAYLKGRSTTDVIRTIKDVIENSAMREDSKVAAFVQSDFSAAFDRVSRKHIYVVLRQM